MSRHWKERRRPDRLEARFEFSDYEATRCFLEDTESVSKETGIYPDISFGRTYVNLTLHADDDGEGIQDEARDFALRVETLPSGAPA